MALLLLWTAVWCPYEVAFLPLTSFPTDWRFILNRTIDGFFLTDMLVQFFIMYPQPARPVTISSMKKSPVSLARRGALRTMVTSRRAIAWNYLTTWFSIDLISLLTCFIDIAPLISGETVESTMTLDEALSLSNATNGTLPTKESTADTFPSQLRILRILRLLRLIKLIRL